MLLLKQSTAATVALGPFLDSTDGNTVESGLTLTQPDIRLSKNGATFAQKNAAQTLAHMENGYYSLALDSTDTGTVGTLVVHVHESGALPVWQMFQVVEEAVYDALYAASATGALPVSTGGIVSGSFASGAITADAIAANAITDVEIANGAITAAKFAAGAITATVIADNAIDAGAIAANAITSAKIAPDAITNAQIATDAITADKIANGAIDAATFAADVDAEILSYLVDDATRLDASELNGLDDKLGTPFGASVSADILQINTNVGVTHAAVVTVDTVVDSILVDTAEIGVAGAGLTAVPWNASWDAEVQSEVTDALEVTLADSIPADGTAPSVKQALYMLCQFLLERSVTGTTCTVRKPDGSTTLLTLTLNDAVTPTSITRSA